MMQRSIGSTTVVALVCAAVAFGQSPPANDACATATALASGANAFSTLGASTDGPAHAGCAAFVFGDDQVHRDVWFRFTATGNGLLFLTTCLELGGTATFDTRLAVYRSGAPCPPATADLLGCNDDDPYHRSGTVAGGYASSLEVAVRKDHVYAVRVGGFSAAASGSGMLFSRFVATPAEDWVFTDQTSTRLSVIASLGTADVEEKDYAWGDVDQDGDVDLVCVRKQPFNTPGRRQNVLFMNEGMAEGHSTNGVLVDRTALLAVDATDGGQGFLDLTNDRDVALVDVNGDGWLDIVTATTYGGGLATSISHPRIYINKATVSGIWQGFRFEHLRTPVMPITPNFCGVAFGDVTGDGSPDLYFVEYNNTLEDRLWVNDGTGTFIDESLLRMTPQMLESDFGVHAVIADMNGDGVGDVVKDRASSATLPPLRVSISYNNPANPGFFNAFEVVYNGSPYHMEVGDLNNDNRLDMVVEDDGNDRYFLNQGNGPNGRAVFVSQTFATLSDSFGGNIVIRDIDRDGFNDVAIADVDVDCCGFTRHMKLWRNLGNIPNVTFEEESGGIPIAARTGTHDVAVFDVDGDTFLDLVIGTHLGTSVWIQNPPRRLEFRHPSGLPTMAAGGGTPFEVEIHEIGAASVVPGSALVHVSVNGGAYAASTLQSLGGGRFGGTLPAAACGDLLRFHFSAQDASGTVFNDPPMAPTEHFSALVVTGLVTTYLDGFEGTVTGWSVVNAPSLTGGAWEVATPIGTLFASLPAAPSQDAEPAPSATRCWVTQNGVVGGSVSAADVDGGPTDLLSPVFNLLGVDATISYRRWFFSLAASDTLVVAVTADGANWVVVESIWGVKNTWEPIAFRVSDHVVPSSTVQVRFRVIDTAPDGVVEAAIDVFRVERLACEICQFDLGGGTPNGAVLTLCGGDLSAGSPADLRLEGVPAASHGWIGVELAPFPQPALGGVVWLTPGSLFLPFFANAKGDYVMPAIPGGLGPLTVFLQAVYFDAHELFGVAISNGLRVDLLP